MVPYARAVRWRSANPLVVTQRWTTTVLDLSVACGGFIAVLLGLEVVAAVTFGGGLEGAPPSGWVLAAERGVLSLVTVLILWVLLRKNGQSFATVGVRTDRLPWALLGGMLAYVNIIGYMLAVMLTVSLLWPGAIGAMQQAQERNIERMPEMGLAAAAVFSLMVAINEELLFRGFVITRLRSLTRSWWASVLITSAVFAAMHIPQGWLPVLLIFGLSIILGFWMIWRGNVLVPIVAHMLFDTTSLMWLGAVREGGT